MQKTLTHRHTRLAYEDTGKGHSVVLLHGFAEDSTVWRHQVALLGEHHRVIAPDWPGSGLSPASPELVSMEFFADLLRALIEQERIERCCVIGHSMGGYAALAFAQAYPGFLTGLGLFHSTAFPDSPEKQQARKRSIAFIRENGAALFLRTATPNLFGDRFKKENPAEVEDLIERGSSANPEVLVSYYEAMLRRPDRTAVLRSARVPVLMIAGIADNAVPLAESLKQAALAPLTFVHFLEDAAHMGMWEAPETAGKVLSDFLRFVYRKLSI
jgi:pimeloyl-ACP methyl ester carboxylesterase